MVDTAVRLETLYSDLCKLQRTVSAVEERLDGILLGLQKLRGAVAAGPAVAIPRSRLSRSTDEQVLRVAAQKGVGEVRVRRYGDHAELRIDGGASIRCTSTLANLLEVLIDDVDSTDHLVGWKPFDDIETALAKQSGRPTSRLAVKNLIYRLRQRLRDAGENPHLVQVWRRRGARFALRRPITPGAEPQQRGACDHQ